MNAPSTSSACHRVLTAVRRYYREHGACPSLGAIERCAGVRRQHVGRYLRRLERDGLLTYRRDAIPPIALTDRAANLSDLELEAAVRGRGGRVDWSVVPALPEAFPVDPRMPPDDAALLHLL